MFMNSVIDLTAYLPEQPAPRRPRVYQDGASDDNRTRRGFTPDTPSFLKRNK